MIRRIVCTIFLMAALIGCNGPKELEIVEDEKLKSFKTEITEGFYNGKTPLFVYNEQLHQTAVNKAKKSYRIQSDQQDVYLNCILAGLPARLDELTTLTVASRAVEGISDKVYNVTLVKKTAEKLWLWDPSSKTGFILNFE